MSSPDQRSAAAPRTRAPRSTTYSTATGQHAGSSHSRRPSALRPKRTGRAAPPAPRGPFDNIPLTVIDEATLPTFAELGLPAGLASALAKSGIVRPFPIQAATIPDAIAGRDVLGRAATGAGKTLAFGLAMLARLEGRPSASKRPRGLVLLPTRELALQVADTLSPLAHSRGLNVRLVAGGLPIGKQIQGLARGVDVLIATPGRLIDLIERRSCDLGDVEVTVLDEADHMADLGFLPVVRRLLDMTPANGQRLLFSATLDGDVATLVTQYLTDPSIKALASPRANVDTMDHHVFRVPNAAKWDVVHQIAAREERTILFVRTKHGADRLARNLNRAGVAAGALHGGRNQAQRTRALNNFKDGSVRALVATDVAARGIHVDDVSLVLHVDPPADPKDYLHRSGRTARAGSSGVVVTIVTPGEERTVHGLLTAAGVRAEQRDAQPGDAGMFAVTGGRQPSGVPIAERPEPVASTSSGWGGRGRSQTARPAGRPSRPTTHRGRPAVAQRSSRG